MAFLTKTLIMVGACLLAGGASAQDRPESYKVAMQIERDGKVIGAPTLVMARGVPAVVTVDGVYSLKTVISPDGGASSTVALSSELYFPQAGTWALVATPSVSMAAGGWADMTLDLPKHGKIALKYQVEVARQP
ncbi:hypothetical protein [Sphingomonas xinjiangensis]|uniref:YtkA-like domain-containing protein n=1 Tax=Sphingomonas xinjiangensis TaxID=643568 RepID=A0A840YGG3_9SPHN|nr:hypothetical protein [Sphingomonas xinjiangensis]MBB5709878.1 hypothetical protein [Sphingomonas xinjiangensis]